MPKPIPVIAAIPNYNMANYLQELLPQLLEQHYDAIYVLDDCSTDTSRELVSSYKGIKLIVGDTNLGAGGNRNRILADWPDIAVTQTRKPVHWTLEGNLFVKRSILEQLGGFDETIKEFDIVRPARRAHEAALVSYFDLAVAVTHMNGKVRNYFRPLAIQREYFQLIRRYAGIQHWLRPDGHFKPRINR